MLTNNIMSLNNLYDNYVIFKVSKESKDVRNTIPQGY